MRHFIILCLSAFLFVACSNKKAGTLEEAFLMSMQKNDFEILRPYLPDITFYKSLGNKMPARTDVEIKKYLEESNEQVRVAWENTRYNTVENKIDLNKVKLGEVLYYDPFIHDEESEAMIITYTYNNQTWDDLQFIVNRDKDKIYLLAIPNPTRAFSLADPSLKASNDAKTHLALQKPEFKKSLEEQVNKIVSAARENNVVEFGSNLLYRGNDEKRLWVSALNVNDTLEKQEAANFMARVRSSMEGCTTYRTGDVNLESGDEGLWIILPVQCENKIVQFAFLKLGDKTLLGDFDAREN